MRSSETIDEAPNACAADRHLRAALLLAIFWFGPFVLVAIGSVIPEANLFSFRRSGSRIPLFSATTTTSLPARFPRRISSAARCAP